MKTPTLIILASIILISASISSGAPRTSSTAKKADPTKSSSNEERRKVEVENARKLVSDLTATQKSKLLALLNEGADEDLSTISGIAKTRATSIIKARPFKDVTELIHVDGFGKATFAKVIAHGKTLTRRRTKAS